MEPPFCTNFHKNAPTERSIIINHFKPHESDADAAPTSHLRACKSGCYYTHLTGKKKDTRVWGGPNGITITSNVVKIGQLDHKQKWIHICRPIIYIYIYIYMTFRGPCIVIYSCNKIQRDALFHKFILV